jgi:hypothetical protein
MSEKIIKGEIFSLSKDNNMLNIISFEKCNYINCKFGTFKYELNLVGNYYVEHTCINEINKGIFCINNNLYESI